LLRDFMVEMLQGCDGVFETMIGERMYLLPRKKSLNEGPALANSREEGKVCGMSVA
jgi:hypothetical protein